MDIIIDQSRLSPCPHCGSIPFISIRTSDEGSYDPVTGSSTYCRKPHYRPECPECGATIRECDTFDEAVENWNRRS